MHHGGSGNRLLNLWKMREWGGVTWRVKDVETTGNSMGDGGMRKSGLIVVGEAGSSSTLDATEAGETKRDGKD